ncbi:MAG: sulfatase [Polyangiaceae bacterium]|nr:sulfatase [Polyangiaceae bacterium]
MFYRHALLVASCIAVIGCKDPGAASKHGPEPAGSAAQLGDTGSAAASSVADSPAVAVPEKKSPKIGLVLLITIDAMRGDQAWTGYELANTPVLSKLAESSVVYTRAYAIANTTGPAISGFLAVRYPTELERDNCPLAGFTIGEGLGAVLSGAGVWTGAAHGNAYFAGSAAPKDGFTDWRVVKNVGGRLVSEGAVTGPEVTDLLIELIEAAPKNKPSFIWGHYLEPHDTYVRHKDFPPSKHPKRGLYDGEVAFADNEVGRVLAAIEASGLKDSTAVIVSADHGEAFGEHDIYRHGFGVFEEEVRVPLLVRVPGQEPKRVEVPRSGIDIPRTIASLLGVEVPSRWRGASLVEDFADKELEERPVIVDVPELMNLPAQQVVVFGKYKVTRLGPRWIVYDLELDPAEKKPIKGAEAAELVERAKGVLGTIETVPHSSCRRQAFK